jgi:beta-lactamase regulating signal transducer with metallopeptidase domain/protocatechuate 3,4-dioxygenase beta subunit
MNDLTDTYGNLALVLLADWSLRWGVAIAVLGVGLVVFRPRRAATRSLLCRLVFIGGLLLPLLPRCWGLALPTFPSGLSAVESQQPATEALPPDLPPQAEVAQETVPAMKALRPSRTDAASYGQWSNEPEPEPVPVPGRRGSVLVPALLLLWLAGVSLLTGRLAWGWIRIVRLRRSARRAGEAALELFSVCRREMGVRRAADLLQHASVRAPILLGGLRPALVVPLDWDELPADCRRAALLHELAHLNRRDDLAKAAEEVVRSFFFFHPLVHWLLNRLDGERERLCDVAVVRHGVTPRQLAQVLLDFTKRLGAGRPAIVPAALPFFNRITVKDRIHQLLEDDMARWITPLSRGWGATYAAVVLGLMIGLGSFGLRATPPEDKPNPTAEQPKKEKKPAEISGVVKDSEGRLVAGADVVLYRPHGNGKPMVTQTRMDGSFTFALPGDKPSGYALTVLAVKAGFAPAQGYAIEGTGKVVLPELSKAATVAGTVHDQEGRPIAGARVQFGTVNRSGSVSSWANALEEETLRGTPVETFFFARTDTEGKFRFTTAPAGRELIFRVEAEGFAGIDTAPGSAKRQHFAKPDAPPVAFVLAPEARINGRVVSRVPGVAVEGLQVWIRGTDRESWGIRKNVRTDTKGRFALRGLPEGGFQVLVDELPDGAAWTVRAVPPVKLRQGKTAAVEIELIEGVLVEGTVVVTDTGKPVAEARVVVHRPALSRSGLARFFAVTDREGRYRLRLPPGETELSAEAPQGFTEPSRIDGLKKVVLPEGVKSFTGPTLTLLRAAALAGRVVDARGRPVAGVEIIGLCRAGTCIRVGGEKVTTDAKGRFRIERGPEGAFPLSEATALQVELPGGKVFEVHTIAAEGEVEVRLPTLADGDGKGPEDVKPDELAGVVVDEKGQPLEGVHVHVWDWVDRPENQTRTGKDGVFRIKDCGRDQKVQVRFRKPGYSPVMFVQQPTGEKGLVVAMDSKTYFEGVVRGPDGKPSANALIRADQGPKQGDGVLITTVWTETKTDATGKYRLYVEPDGYAFQVKAPGVGVARLPKQPIAHGQAKPFDIRLQPGVTFRAVTVDVQTGKPVAGVRLWNWQHKDVEGRSDTKGQVAISEMLPGPFDFEIEAAGYARFWSADANNEYTRAPYFYRKDFQDNLGGIGFDLQPGMAPVKIVLEKGVRITGRVVAPDGKPVAGATVAPALTGTGNSLTGDTRFSVVTKPDGTFEMLLPASGQAKYNLVAHDGKYGEWRRWANGVLPPMQTTPGQLIKEVTLELTKPATVRGKVVDAQGKPVAYREVRAHAADKLENRYYDPTTTTKQDGTFELRFIRPGEHFIQAAPFWLTAEEAPDKSTRKLRLAAGETVEGIELLGQDPSR